MKRKTIQDIQNKKKHGKKITMLTAYDYPLASLIDEAGIDIILVGDSLANVVLGLDSTLSVGMDAMIHHAQAVNRAVKAAMVVGDMPFDAYQINPGDAVVNARRFIDQAGCDAVKVEWFDGCLPVIENILDGGINVMGHVGLTPQTAEQLGGFKVQGKNVDSAKKIIDQAKALEERGCFSIVVECVPSAVAKIIAEEISIPTISCGGGLYCDGQVLVINDLLGLSSRHSPKFVKQYVNLKEIIKKQLILFREEVEASAFPDDAHSYAMNKKEFERLIENYRTTTGD